MKAPDIVTASDSKVILRLDEGLYPLDVIYGAAYVFIDRAYVLLGRDGAAVVVTLTAKGQVADAELEAIAGEFGNELLSQALRRRITQENQGILETIVSQALAGATGASVPSAFADDEDDDDLDFLDDPLGIAVPWEERFKKQGAEPAQQGPDAEKTAGPGDAGGHDPVGGE
jgi:His-Xaa-Ser system protein HxsD